MAHVSVMKKLERCERIGQAEAKAILHADTHHLIKYKVKIKDYNSTSTHVPTPYKLLHVLQSKTPSPPSLPCTKVQLVSLQSLHDHEVQSSPPPPLKLSSCTGTDQDASCTSWSSWKLDPSNSYVLQCALLSSEPDHLQALQKREENPSSPFELKTAARKEPHVGRGGPGPSLLHLQDEVQEKSPAGRGSWEAVKKMECECCSMEEECTEGYEERVRARLRGHWLCGLCEEAVGEEKKRVGGSMQAALVAHMQPCKGFSGRARARVSPPLAEVAVPRAVCRLLSRHLSTPSPHRPISPTALSRSTSCISSLPNS